VSTHRLVERIWYGDAASARLARAALTPASALFGAVASVRNRLYDAGVLPQHRLALPAVSVGNISVGGTGKTPVAAWLSRELDARGMRPAIVLRGYGGDEPLVHQRLNPSVGVVVAPDRVEGARRAAALGADVVVLDDALQHRRARREVDVVLVSADRWLPGLRVLPAGPLRESTRALERAALVLVTRKAASRERAEEVARWLGRRVPAERVGVVHLAPAALVEWRGGRRTELSALRGRQLRVVAAIGDPEAFRRQLEGHGATVSVADHRDHHRFARAEVEQLAASVPPASLLVCTLKDAVKLGPLWPATGPDLWYVAQDVILERGHEALSRSLDRLHPRAVD